MSWTLSPAEVQEGGRSLLRVGEGEGGGGRGVVKEGSSAWPARMGRNSPWEKSSDMKKSETKVQAGEVSWPGPQPLGWCWWRHWLSGSSPLRQPPQWSEQAAPEGHDVSWNCDDVGSSESGAAP